ncbi:MAG TPA: hypothetical protein VKU86_03350 [Acidimicrobiales bacterium]|nr:hypothetical protein [Acidimicrobiales bacterium]
MRRFSKVGMSAAAVALAASGIVTALAGPASAKGGPHGKVTCTSMNGSTGSGTITLSGCSGTATPGTGGSSQPLSIAVLAAGGTVTWINNQTTTFGAPNLVGGNPKHCPGYAKGASSEPSDEKFSGQVTADTTGMKVPGKYKGEVCIDQSGNITARKPLKIS